MTTQPESAYVPTDIHIVRDDIPKNNPYRQTIYDARLSNALVTYAKSTR